MQECKDRLDNMSARAIAADFVTHRNVQMHYTCSKKLRATSLGLTDTSFTSLYRQLHLRTSVWEYTIY